MSNKIIIKKELNTGYNNKVFLIEIENKLYVLKKLPIIDTNIKNYKLPLWREIDMSLFINKLSKENINFFMKLKDFKIVKCKEIYEDFSNMEQIKINTNKCLEIIYEYKGLTLKTILLKNKIKLKEKYSMILQVIHAINILKKGGYIHNDIHSNNITFKKFNKILKVGNKKFYSENIYSLIDYGFNKHKKYKIKDQYVNEYLDINWDLLYFIRQVILQTDILISTYKKKNIIRDWIPSFKMEDLLEIYNEERKIWNKIKKTLLKKGKDYVKWFEKFENNKIEYFYEDFKKEYPILKISNKNKINISIPIEISILFSAYNRKKWLKLNKWDKVYIPNLINSQDIEFLILNLNNFNKLKNYFYQICNQR